jgi:hypothetical protein
MVAKKSTATKARSAPAPEEAPIPEHKKQGPFGVGKDALVAGSTIMGEIKNWKFDEETGQKRILLAWDTGEEDGQHERWFFEHELEAEE